MEKSLFRPEHRILISLVRQLRIDAGLTQEQLAVRLKVPRTTITKWETGQQRLDVLEFWSYCEAVQVDPLDLLGAFKAAIAKR